MSGRIKNEIFIEKLITHYKITDNTKGSFLLQVDWLLENAVYPKDNSYAENLIDLWNVYMPGYDFDKVILEYSKKCLPALRFVHDNEIYKFNSVIIMQECTIKNYVKYLITQGETNRLILIKECFELLKDVSDRSKLYEAINQIINKYFLNSEIEQYSIIFLKKFQDYGEQPYIEILERLKDINIQREQSVSARPDLYLTLGKKLRNQEEFLSLINVLLCKIALADGERKWSDVLKDAWSVTFLDTPYNDKIYSFIEKFEKPYMAAACFGIQNVRDKKVVQQLYKDAVILSTVLEAIEKGNSHYGLKEINEFWKNDGKYFSSGFFFDDEYERMKEGFKPEIIMAYKSDIINFHEMILQRIKAMDVSSVAREKRDVASEMFRAGLNLKGRQIDALQERVSELEEKVENTEKEVLSQFISLLDSKRYGYVLGKLYRLAYTDETMRFEDIKRILRNLFEIMNISGIDIYGEIGTKVNTEEIKKGKYRVNGVAKGTLEVKYPGYKVGNSVILYPVSEEE